MSLTILKKIKRTVAAVVVSAIAVSSSFVMPIGAEGANGPYDLISGGCVKSVKMHSSQNMDGGLVYYTAEVRSHIQGELTRAEIPYDVYGAIGNGDTRMFVYSVGDDSDQDYKNHKVVEIVEKFERDNPAWDALVAVNGDFFDIETALTSSTGEPEGPMIQLGSVIKGNLDNVTGRGVVGVKRDGTMIYETAGDVYDQNGYGSDFGVSKLYLDVTFSDKDTGKALHEYSSCYGDTFYRNEPYLSTVNSNLKNLSGRTVCVIRCDKYRYSHVPANGVEGGTLGNYVLGEVVEIRDGSSSEKVESGYALLSFPSKISTSEIKIGMKVECEPQLKGEWKDVTNAVGFKQQILADGNVLLKNCYGTYNKQGNYEETLRWTADIYDYPHCWKNRTVLGFKADGSPVLLVAARSSHTGAYKNLGASYYEMGEQLKALGCVNGFLLDGGGSSTFVIRNSDGTFSNAFVGEGNGRAVANAVILAVRDKSVPLPEEEEKQYESTAEQTSDVQNTDTTTVPNEENESTEDSSKWIFATAFVGAVVVVVVAGAVFVHLKKRKG